MIARWPDERGRSRSTDTDSPHIGRAVDPSRFIIRAARSADRAISGADRVYGRECGYNGDVDGSIAVYIRSISDRSQFIYGRLVTDRDDSTATACKAPAGRMTHRCPFESRPKPPYRTAPQPHTSPTSLAGAAPSGSGAAPATLPRARRGRARRPRSIVQKSRRPFISNVTVGRVAYKSTVVFGIAPCVPCMGRRERCNEFLSHLIDEIFGKAPCRKSISSWSID